MMGVVDETHVIYFMLEMRILVHQMILMINKNRKV